MCERFGNRYGNLPEPIPPLPPPPPAPKPKPKHRGGTPNRNLSNSPGIYCSYCNHRLHEEELVLNVPAYKELKYDGSIQVYPEAIYCFHCSCGQPALFWSKYFCS